MNFSDIIGSLQLAQRFRKAVPQAKQYFDRKSVHIWSGVVPGVQHLGQNFNVVIVSGETFFAAASKYSGGIPNAEAKPPLAF
ncbi:MAG: hypothetical protein CLLPBCKN_006357 [Chroococcidiopsis cubana SAG 39.79]|uniref:Uncharacterized protein n=1 Tax=Chroococcidiopsis cubana SAG 39.79 TaxID=388085 RepID=A0AB37UB35_9CYAN|nr:hypothetical protein [Chroococcidiopsis cubana]MDZ4876922.1 hypothetical protein [Chroococcidiopsis cubana SAG 39.79]RUT02661.1 hypothetical protein DSM107010_62390 [Chroococcidiopsis cubana SAG 39.79]